MPAGDDIFLDTLDSSHKNFEEETSRFHKEAAADQAMKTTDLNTLLAEHEAKKAAGSLSPRGRTSVENPYNRPQPSFQHGDKEGMEYYTSRYGHGRGAAPNGNYPGADSEMRQRNDGYNGRHITRFARRTMNQAYREKQATYLESERDFIEAERKAAWKENPYDPALDTYRSDRSYDMAAVRDPMNPDAGVRRGHGIGYTGTTGVGDDEEDRGYAGPSIYNVAANNPTGRALLQCVNEVEREKQLEYERQWAHHHENTYYSKYNDINDSFEARVARSNSPDRTYYGGIGAHHGGVGAYHTGYHTHNGLFTPEGLALRYKEEKIRRGEEWVTRERHPEHGNLYNDIHLAAADPHLERALRGHEDQVTSVAFTEHGQLVSGSKDATVTVWPMKSTNHAIRFTGHLDAVNSVSASPGGKLIASGSADKTVRLWLIDDLWAHQAPGQSAVFKAHNAAVNSVDFSSTGKSLLTASDDGEMKVWTIPNQELRQTMTIHHGVVNDAKFSKDGKLTASAGGGIDHTVKIYDLHRQTTTGTFYHHEDNVNSVSWLSHSMLCSGSDDRSIKLYDLRCGKMVLQFLEAHRGPVTDVSFHPTGQHIASSSTDGVVKIWDLRAADCYYKLNAHEGWVNAVAFNDEGNFFATGGKDEQVMLWKSNFDKVEKKEHSEPIVPASPFEDGVAPSLPGFNLNINCPSKGPVQYGTIKPKSILGDTRSISQYELASSRNYSGSSTARSLAETQPYDSRYVGKFPTVNHMPREYSGGHGGRSKENSGENDGEDGPQESKEDQAENESGGKGKHSGRMWGLQRGFNQSKKYGGYGTKAEKHYGYGTRVEGVSTSYDGVEGAFDTF